jgi:sulfate/thiosulfate transport system substrate-binding protein
MKRLLLLSTVFAAVLSGTAFAEAPNKILNASYDIGRELFVDINAAFIPKYKAETGKDLEVSQSHAGSSKQARAILEGLEADVVTFNQVTDIDALVRAASFPTTGRRILPTMPRPIIRCRHSLSARATRRTSRTGTTWCATT